MLTAVRRITAVGLLGALALGAPRAAAQPSAEQQRMTARMERYFAGEKAEGWVFLGTGVAALGSGVFLYTRRDDLAKGASYPVAAVGLVELAAGIVLLARTDGQVRDRRARIARDPAGFKRDETERMDRVASEFTLLKWTEIGLLAGGLGLFSWGALDEKRTLQGVGLGLAAQSAVMLTLDLFAAARADTYLDDLHAFQPSAAAQGSTLTVMLPIAGSF